MSRPKRAVDLRLLSKVGKLYYQQGLTQHEIAERLALSRPKVSRLLQQAQDEGVVQISVLAPPGVHADLEERLERQYGLQEAVVVPVDGPRTAENVSREIGQAAAEYLGRTISSGDVVGISWGRTLSAMVNALRPTEVRGLHVVQMIGGLGSPEAEVHATELCRRLAHVLGSRLTLLPAPGIVASRRVKEAMLSDQHVRAALDALPSVRLAFVGIGAPMPGSLLVEDGAIMRRDELDDLLGRGAVGDIALRFLDGDGRPVVSDLDERVIGITRDQLGAVPRVVGVAGGPDKAPVIRAALRSGLLDVLITDDESGARVAGVL